VFFVKDIKYLTKAIAEIEIQKNVGAKIYVGTGVNWTNHTLEIISNQFATGQ
jgi:hypothetical protein